MNRARGQNGLFACPCCGFATLVEVTGYVICHISFWEDNGQDDPASEENWGEDGGRHAPFWENYRPHLIPEGTEDYLGVTVVGLAEDQAIAPGDSAEVDFDLVYHPNVDYGGLSEGTRFEIREGARAVGTGTVLNWIGS